MRVFRGLSEVEHAATSVTIGTFDGVHRAHQQILRRVRELAATRGERSAVVTFDPHPQEVIRSRSPDVKILTTIDERIDVFAAEGIDVTFVVPFTREFSELPPEQFVRHWLVDGLGSRAIVVGHDHGFGRGRSGDASLLRDLGTQLGFDVEEIAPLEWNGDVVSSTRIRNALLAGDVALAASLLGRPYRLSGHVVRGDARGRTIGFPTANVIPPNQRKLIPGRGVYFVRFLVGEKPYDAMLNVGIRPTFGGTAETIEAHVLDFDGDLYGMRVAVDFLARIREEKRFDSVAELIEQLGRDRESARALAGR
jgi:riboflavin kinase/FMN adenylyltransferase